MGERQSPDLKALGSIPNKGAFLCLSAFELTDRRFGQWISRDASYQILNLEILKFRVESWYIRHNNTKPKPMKTPF